MNILIIHRFFHIQGGGERYVFELSRLLKKMGHNVAFFSMHDKNNQKSPWNKYFVSNVSIMSTDLVSRFRLIGRMTYSFEAKRKLSKLIKEFRPDIAHIHNYNVYLSPSILHTLKHYGIPAVQTVHDYHLIAPTRGSLFHNGKICEITKKNKYYRAIFHKCIGGSIMASFIFTVVFYLHKLFNFEEYITTYIAPSHFMKKKLVEYGLSGKKIKYLPIFSSQYAMTTVTKKKFEKKYILYFGRLSPEKGLETLIKAMDNLPNIPLKIVGTGRAKYLQSLKSLAKRSRNIEFVGFKKWKDLKKIIMSAYFCILPSVWYENSPYSAIESFSLGKPVIASKIGGIPEIVKHKQTGLLFDTKNKNDLYINIKNLWSNDNLYFQLSKNSGYIIKENDSSKHYDNLILIYKSVNLLYKIKS